MTLGYELGSLCKSINLAFDLDVLLFDLLFELSILLLQSIELRNHCLCFLRDLAFVFVDRLLFDPKLREVLLQL